MCDTLSLHDALPIYFNIDVQESQTSDVEEIHRISKEAIEHMRKESRPCFLHLAYYRYLEHVGVYDDFKSGYRNREAFEQWVTRDPVKLQRERLSEFMDQTEIEMIEREVALQIAESIAKAKAAPMPAAEVLYEDVLK
jgi:TPP-dependent pyruvate/acetoin dehydrogenase alpha subunit